MGQRLLIVDSDRRFIQDHQAALESTFEVDFLSTTDGALARLESGQYTAVLLCVEVSENKGYSLCSTLRKAPGTQHLKIALISGKATQEEYARHQSLKGRADLYLHKPIATSALIAALSRFVPVKMEDPDNPLGDLGGPEVADEWLESLKTELELEGPSHAAPAPEAASVFSLPLPPLPLPPTVPMDSGQVAFLESRVQDLEGRLAAKAEELDEALKELAELNQRHESATRNLGDFELAQTGAEQARQTVAALESRIQGLEAELEASNGSITRNLEERDNALALLRDLETQAAGAQDALTALRARLEEQAQLNMDSLEANMLLQAQMEEAREAAVKHQETARALAEAQEGQARAEALLLEKEDLCRELGDRCAQQEGKLGELEAKCGDCTVNRERLQESFAALEREVATLEANHERQQLELLAGIDERDGQLARLNATLDAQQERLLTLERQKGESVARAQAQTDRLRTLHGLLAELEGKAREGLDLADAPNE